MREAEWKVAMRSSLEARNLTPMNALRHITCPTLLLVPVSVTHEVGALIRGSELTVVPKAGHSIALDGPSTHEREIHDTDQLEQ